MTSGPTNRRATPQQEAAADWLLRVQGGDAEELAAFEAWLAADARNRAAWAQIARAWQRIGEQPPAHAGLWAGQRDSAEGPAARHTVVRRPSPGSRESMAGRRGRPIRRKACAAVLAAAACLLLVLFLPGLLLRFEAEQRTGTGELRRIALADGSLVVLAPQSAIDWDFSGGRRAVHLLEGQAFFEVRRDPAHPFTVAADAVQVTVLGTAFDVRLSADSVSVGVREGRVQVDYPVDYPGDDPLGEGREGRMRNERLNPGDALTVARDGEGAQRETPGPSAIASWLDGRLFVDGATVAEVVERLRPYRDGWIVIADSVLARQKVTGLYDLSRPDLALRALVEPYGGRVHGVMPFLRVLTGSDAAPVGKNSSHPGK